MRFLMYSLKRGMMISVAIPLAVALLLSSILAGQNAYKLADARRIVVLHDMVEAMSALIHEQQRERGGTSVFLSSEGAEFAAELDLQRARTDSAVARFRDALARSAIDAGSPLAADVTAIVAYLDARDGVRGAVDALDIATPAALAHYTEHNARMLDAIVHVASATSQPAIAAKVAALEALLLAKEYAGIERAIGSGGFASGAFDYARVRRLEGLITRQSVGLDRFAVIAEAPFRDAAARIAASDVMATIERLREVAFRSLFTGDLGGLSAGDYFAATTERIDALKALEDRMIEDISGSAAALVRSTMTAMLVVIAAQAAALGLSAAITALVIRRMLREVRRIADAGDRLARGDETAELPDDSPMELARIVRSIDFFRRSVREGMVREAETTRQREEAERESRDAEERRQTVEKEKAQREAASARAEQDRLQGYVASISDMVGACARGDFARRLELEDAEGAWAEVRDGLNAISTGVERSLSEIRRALEHMARGDMTYRPDGRFDGIFREIADAVCDANENISRMLSRVAGSVGAVSSASREIASTSVALSRSSEENAERLRATTDAIEEMSGLVRSATDASQKVRGTVVSVSERAEADGRAAGETIRAMEEIRTSSEDIVKTLSVIDEIAFQTNLLALNAGVEAARAGDAGRGFAVVAMEVRALAGRSSEAAQKIAELVETSAETIHRGVGLVDRTANSLNGVVASIQDITSQIGQMTDAFETTQGNIDQVADATSHLDRSTRANVGKIEAARRSVQALDAEARLLATEVDAFRIQAQEAEDPEDGAARSAA